MSINEFNSSTYDIVCYDNGITYGYAPTLKQANILLTGLRLEYPELILEIEAITFTPNNQSAQQELQL